MSRASDLAALEAVRELTQAMQAAEARFTSAVATLAGLSLNNVLRSELLTLGPTTGHAHRESRTPFATVGVWAYDSDVTVEAGPTRADTPAKGIGVLFVPAGKAIVWPLAGTEISLQGTANARVLIALWSAPQGPNFGLAGAVGGTP